MHELRSHHAPATAYDNDAYATTSTYHSATGDLTLYTVHPTQSSDPTNQVEYRMTQLHGWKMTGNLDAFSPRSNSFDECPGLGSGTARPTHRRGYITAGCEIWNRQVYSRPQYAELPIPSQQAKKRMGGRAHLSMRVLLMLSQIGRPAPSTTPSIRLSPSSGSSSRPVSKVAPSFDLVKDL